VPNLIADAHSRRSTCSSPSRAGSSKRPPRRA
jgi:hypothetical protein